MMEIINSSNGVEVLTKEASVEAEAEEGEVDLTNQIINNRYQITQHNQRMKSLKRDFFRFLWTWFQKQFTIVLTILFLLYLWGFGVLGFWGFFGRNKFSRPNGRLSPIACLTYLESYGT